MPDLYHIVNLDLPELIALYQKARQQEDQRLLEMIEIAFQSKHVVTTPCSIPPEEPLD